MKFKNAIFFTLGLLLSANLFAKEIYLPANIKPPEVPREFRGAWMTCVANKPDWPSRPGLTVAQQKAEMISLFDRAAQLHLNAIIFQIRPACDAMYSSALEPWSEDLTGAQGRAPEPFYDPLTFAIQEAHKRGLELHAWFNPFRAWHPLSKSKPAWNHVIKTHPEWIRKYGSQTWLDPGIPAVRAYVTSVVMDVVKRYDVDGVQFDDYFYPYPEKNADGHVMEFPDDATWKHSGSHLSRDDWRRANINEFIHGVYQNIKSEKPWVKFGVSPFGIWRPGYPKQIRGLDSYANLYADSRLWLANGWVDYFAPQLYWAIDAPQQSFPVLLNWWAQQNIKRRILCPGLSAASVGSKFSPDEIARQIQITRAQRGAGGEIFYHLKNLLDDRELNNLVRRENAQVALVPAMTWLDSTPPEKPKMVATRSHGEWTVQWESPSKEFPRWWILQYRDVNQIWRTRIFFGNQNGCEFSWQPEILSIRAVDRFGNMSPPDVLEMKNAE